MERVAKHEHLRRKLQSPPESLRPHPGSLRQGRAVRIASAFGVPVASLVGDTPFTGPLRTPSPTPPKKDILDDLIDTNLQRLARQHLGKLPPRQVEERKKFFRKVLALLICEQDKEKEAEADGGEES